MRLRTRARFVKGWGWTVGRRAARDHEEITGDALPDFAGQTVPCDAHRRAVRTQFDMSPAVCTG